MGSEVEHKIPVINLGGGNLSPGSDSWVLACKEVRYAMEEYGCFEIFCDEFPLEFHNSIFGAAKDLFDLPIETKIQKTSDRPGAIGFVGEHPNNPRYETIGIDSPNTLQGAEYFSKIMWPAGNDNFRETVHSMSKRLVELYEMVIRMVIESYGVEISQFDSIKESTFHILRFFKYRAPRSNETDLGLRPHRDSGFISIVHQHQVEGLQIKMKDGRWIDVRPSSSSFVVLAGYLFMAWSNDRILACEHQVATKEEKIRYSLGLFTYTKGLIHVPEEMVDDKHPLLYKLIDGFGYHVFHISEEGQKSACPIKAYCGI